VAVAPASGGYISLSGEAPLSMNKKTVTFVVGLTDGTATTGVIVEKLK
jgi:hypothetical protein